MFSSIMSYVYSFIPGGGGGGGGENTEQAPNGSNEPSTEVIKNKDEITSIFFNQTNSLFSVGTTSNFLVVKTDDLRPYCKESKSPNPFSFSFSLSFFHPHS